jgi:hypothetical protein
VGARHDLGDGERIPVRGGKTTEVLIRLALEAGVTHRTLDPTEALLTGAAPVNLCSVRRPP